MASKKTATRLRSGKPRRKPAAKTAAESNGDTAIAITGDRLANAKEAERHLNDARLAYEEGKAKYGAARAEHKLLEAKRNRIISTATEPEEVQEAQRQVTLARRRMAVAKDVAMAAKEELAGWQEALQKALSDEQPLFDVGSSQG